MSVTQQFICSEMGEPVQKEMIMLYLTPGTCEGVVALLDFLISFTVLLGESCAAYLTMFNCLQDPLVVNKYCRSHRG